MTTPNKQPEPDMHEVAKKTSHLFHEGKKDKYIVEDGRIRCLDCSELFTLKDQNLTENILKDMIGHGWRCSPIT